MLLARTVEADASLTQNNAGTDDRGEDPKNGDGTFVAAQVAAEATVSGGRKGGMHF